MTSYKHMQAETLYQSMSLSTFVGSDSLKTITLPDKYYQWPAGQIDIIIFECQDNLENIYIENNQYIVSKNGFLYDKETDEIIFFPNGR